MHAEEHPRCRDGDRDPSGGARQDRARARRAAPPCDQREARVARRRCRRVSAREGGPRREGQGIDGRAHAVDAKLDEVGDEVLPDDVQGQKHGDRPVRNAAILPDSDDHRDRNDRDGRAEQCHRA